MSYIELDSNMKPLKVAFWDDHAEERAFLYNMCKTVKERENIQSKLKACEHGYQGVIIFISGSDEHWREAFEVKAFNYITKDTDMEKRFIKIFWEAFKEVNNRRGKTLLFSSLGETRNIDIHAISHFRVKNLSLFLLWLRLKVCFLATMVL